MLKRRPGSVGTGVLWTCAALAANKAAAANIAKPLRPTPAIPASPPVFVSSSTAGEEGGIGACRCCGMG